MSAKNFQHPHQLPVKIRATCVHSFTGRRNWAATWEQVRNCPDTCRAGKNAAPAGAEENR